MRSRVLTVPFLGRGVRGDKTSENEVVAATLKTPLFPSFKKKAKEGGKERGKSRSESISALPHYHITINTT